MYLYKITPMQKSITLLEYDGSYEGMKEHLKYEMWDSVRLNVQGDYLILNDTGLLDGTEQRDGCFWFLCGDSSWRKFVGNALVVGSGWGDDNSNPFITREEQQAKISYMKPDGAEEPSTEFEIRTFDTMDDLLKELFG